MRKIYILMVAIMMFAPALSTQAVMQSLNGLTGQNQTFSNDSNVTIISSGTNHSLGWSGVLQPNRGGTGINIESLANGSVLFNDNGVIGGESKFLWDKVNNILLLGVEESGATIKAVDANSSSFGSGGILSLVAGNANVAGLTGGHAELFGGTGTVAGSYGGAVGIAGGDGMSGGGSASIVGGAGNDDSNGGFVSVMGGPGTGTGNGGSIDILAGEAQGSGAGGNITLSTSNGNGVGDVGNITMQLGNGGTSNRGGSVSIFAGEGGSSSGPGGVVVIDAGASNDGDGGYIQLQGGTAGGANGNGGDVTLSAGAGSGTGRHGQIRLEARGGSGTAVLDIDSITGEEIFTFQNASGTIPLLLGTTDQTIYVGSDGVPGCIAIGDSDGIGVTYINANNGVLSASSTKPSNCQ